MFQDEEIASAGRASDVNDKGNTSPLTDCAVCCVLAAPTFYQTVRPWLQKLKEGKIELQIQTQCTDWLWLN